MYQAKVERHSVGPTGQELVSFVIEFPRVVLAESVTHRTVSDSWGDGYSFCERTTTPDISKNSASSRAIPHARFVEKIKNDPYLPAWTGTKAGMQGDPLPAGNEALVNEVWLDARNDALSYADSLNRLGVHKQDSNRLLEPWAWVTQVVTSTGNGWSNFFALRCHEMAHPAIRKVARMMYLAYRPSTPQLLGYDQWHLPFVPAGDALALRWPAQRLSKWEEMPSLLRQSSARCAWISYENHEKDATLEAVDRTCERLTGSVPKHSSPFEHQGTPELHAPSSWNGNLPGWFQLRKLLQGERATTYAPTETEVQSWPEFVEFQ